MGSICWVHSDPHKWKAWNTGKRLKEDLGGEELFWVCFGSLDDEGIYDLEMYMRRSVYEKAKAGEYKVSPNSKWKRKLILVDAAGNEIPPLNEFCY